MVNDRFVSQYRCETCRSDYGRPLQGRSDIAVPSRQYLTVGSATTSIDTLYDPEVMLTLELARKKELEQERAEYWKSRADNVKSEHEATRLFVEYRDEALHKRLNDFDKRSASEMRLHAKNATWGFWIIILALIFQSWWR